jgi:acetylornithine/succinyldiaminopimelate/putrescine aminotransferase/predicted amino acid dehydrogenase
MNALNPTRAALLETFGLDQRIVAASGCRMTDDAGRVYVDFLAQYGALPFGHNPKDVWAAIRAAGEAEAPAMLQPMRNLAAERLAERLAEVTPGDLGIVTFTNSGAETVEAAIKLARVRTGRDVILGTERGFHGKTLGALSATGNPAYSADFGGPAPGFDHVPFGDLEALKARLAHGDVAAFVVEPIQGEGGVHVPPEGYLDAAIAACREAGVLSIVDEIQTGLGRTGALFACSEGAEVPDMLMLAKALGGGLVPVGALVVRPEAWDDRFGRLHSSTFAGNGLAAAAGLAVLERLTADEGALVVRVRELGGELASGLAALKAEYPDVIRDVRGRGFMQGVEFQHFDDGSSAALAFASLNGGVTALIASWLMNVEGVLTAPMFNASHVLRLQPPLIAGQEEIDRVLEALGRLCAVMRARDAGELVRHLLAAPKSPAVLREEGPRRGGGAVRPGAFGFLIHYTEEEDILRSDPSFRGLSEAERSEWQEWVKRLGAGMARKLPPVRSRTGAVAEGCILSVPMLPEDMRGRGRAAATAMIRDAVDLAGAQGMGRVGLGAFTSIVTRGGETVTGRGPAITSGNTLTTVAAVESLEAVARRTGVRLAEAHVVVVGASGAIGRLAAMMLARRAGQVTLVGNAANPFAPRLLARVAEEVRASLRGARAHPALGAGRLHLAARAGGAATVAWTTDRRVALAAADVVLVATSSETRLVDPAELAPGTLVCDVARPPNVERAEAARHGVLVFDGGLVVPPEPVDLGPFRTLPPELCWGCLGETMLLALAREEGDFSIGSRLPLEDADRLSMLARRHGFRPAPPQWYGTRLHAGDLDRFGRTVADMQDARRVATGSGGWARAALAQ